MKQAADERALAETLRKRPGRDLTDASRREAVVSVRGARLLTRTLSRMRQGFAAGALLQQLCAQAIELRQHL
jgi:hypothetical protein